MARIRQRMVLMGRPRILILAIVSFIMAFPCAGQPMFPGVIASAYRYGVFSGHHAMVHDYGIYVCTDDFVNGDYIGYVHPLCTDSIFNDRSGDSYSFRIISGNPNAGYAINSSTGLITVSNASGISADYTLGVEVEYDGVIDTADCAIWYFTTDIYYYDLSKTSSGTGTYSDPYPNTQNWHTHSGGDVVLFKRGTSMTMVSRSGFISNDTGEWLIYGAYGQGTRPFFTQNTSANSEVFYIGSSSESDDADAGDSIIIMDIRAQGWASTYDNKLVELRRLSDPLWVFRCRVADGDDDAAIHLRGATNTDCDHLFVDIQGDSIGYSGTSRIIKCEAGGSSFYNIWGTHNDDGGIYLGAYGGSSLGEITLKYYYNEGTSGSGSGYATDIRDGQVTAEWLVYKEWNSAIVWADYDYYGQYPTVDNVHIKNVLIEDSDSYAIYDNIDASTSGNYTDPHQDILLENVVMYDGDNKGIYVTEDTEHLKVKNCIVYGMGGYGIHSDSDVDSLTIDNTILYNNTTYDAYIAGISYDTVRNVIWDTYSNDAVPVTNYDVGTSGNPFVDETNYDFRSDVGAGTIDNGTDFGQPTDIIGNTIGTQDIGPYEYGTNDVEFNWPKRE